MFLWLGLTNAWEYSSNTHCCLLDWFTAELLSTFPSHAAQVIHTRCAVAPGRNTRATAQQQWKHYSVGTWEHIVWFDLNSVFEP